MSEIKIGQIIEAPAGFDVGNTDFVPCDSRHLLRATYADASPLFPDAVVQEVLSGPVPWGVNGLSIGASDGTRIIFDDIAGNWYYSDDNAETWAALTTPPGTNIYFLGHCGNRFVALEQSTPSIYVSSDHGATWNTFTSLLGVGIPEYFIALDATYILIIGNNGNVEVMNVVTGVTTLYPAHMQVAITSWWENQTAYDPVTGVFIIWTWAYPGKYLCLKYDGAGGITGGFTAWGEWPMQLFPNGDQEIKVWFDGTNFVAFHRESQTVFTADPASLNIVTGELTWVISVASGFLKGLLGGGQNMGQIGSALFLCHNKSDTTLYSTFSYCSVSYDGGKTWISFPSASPMNCFDGPRKGITHGNYLLSFDNNGSNYILRQSIDSTKFQVPALNQIKGDGKLYFVRVANTDAIPGAINSAAASAALIAATQAAAIGFKADDARLPATVIAAKVDVEGIIPVVGSGPNTVTITVYEHGTVTPIGTYALAFYASDGVTFLGTLNTNASGQVTTNLPTDTFKISGMKVGYSPDNTVETFAVAPATLTKTVYATPVSVGLPGASNVCRVYEYCFEANSSTPLASVTEETRICRLPFDRDGKLHAGDVITSVYNATTGLLYWDIVWDAQAEVKIKNIFDGTARITIPRTASARLKSLLR